MVAGFTKLPLLALAVLCSFWNQVRQLLIQEEIVSLWKALMGREAILTMESYSSRRLFVVLR